MFTSVQARCVQGEIIILNTRKSFRKTFSLNIIAFILI